ncbi:MAG: SGNH/GDSL hydrolase family protein [Verrucomicrobiales bacterium]
MKTFLFAALFFLVTSPAGLSAKVTEVVVFGDSLSDNGNVNALSFGIVPSDDYFGSRVFSNGAPWVRFLALGLGVANPDNSRSGTAIATNYAYGGAKSGGGGSSFESVIVKNIAQQIDEFVGDGRKLTEGSLVVLWIGGNDLNGTSSSGAKAQISTTIENVESHLNEIIELGARQILVPSVPLLGEVPQHNGNPAEREQQNTLTSDYNSALAALQVSLSAAHPAVRIVSFDVAGIVSQLLNDPAEYGFKNVTDQAYTPGFLGGSLGSSTVPNPNEYAFWDDLHPTGPVHRLLGELAAATVKQLPLPESVDVTLNEGTITVSFGTEAWASYAVAKSTDLKNWTTIATDLQGTGAIIEVPDSGTGQSDQAYYRVEVK